MYCCSLTNSQLFRQHRISFDCETNYAFRSENIKNKSNHKSQEASRRGRNSETTIPRQTNAKAFSFTELCKFHLNNWLCRFACTLVWYSYTTLRVTPYISTKLALTLPGIEFSLSCDISSQFLPSQIPSRVGEVYDSTILRKGTHLKLLVVKL